MHTYIEELKNYIRQKIPNVKLKNDYTTTKYLIKLETLLREHNKPYSFMLYLPRVFRCKTIKQLYDTVREQINSTNYIIKNVEYLCKCYQIDEEEAIELLKIWGIDYAGD